jgi:RNA polymerase subunit RPABC4/transcription elongation factor Spt4
MFCPSCSRSVPEGSTFCPWCGKSLSLGSCPHCGAKAPDGAQFCLSCGKPLTKEGNPPAPLANVGNVTITTNAAPPQGGTQAVAQAQDPYRDLRETNEPVSIAVDSTGISVQKAGAG